MPLMLSRTATVVSLTQLASEPDCPLAALAAVKGSLSTPDQAVSSISSGASLLPLYSFPSQDGFQSKRVRSFGSFQDLSAAGASAVPDVDDVPAASPGGPALGGASDDDALSDGSSDSGAQARRRGGGVWQAG